MSAPYDKLLEKGSASRSQPCQKERRKTRAATFAVASNTTLVLLKLVTGLGTGSLSILSEAAHSAADLIASGIAFLSVRASATPADEEHPYGHGKIEGISGLTEGVLIFGAALYIAYESWMRLRTPVGHTAHGINVGLVVMAFSAGVNALLSSYLFRVAAEMDSLALRADAEHLRSDIFTSVGVLCGLGLARLTGWPWFDPLAALAVAGIVSVSAFRLIQDALNPLLDSRLPAHEEAAIRHLLDSNPRVLGYHKLRTRKSGSQRHADVHVQMEDNSTLVEAHDFTEELEDDIRAAFPDIQIAIHIEPFQAEMRHQQEVHGVPGPHGEMDGTEQRSSEIAHRQISGELRRHL